MSNTYVSEDGRLIFTNPATAVLETPAEDVVKRIRSRFAFWPNTLNRLRSVNDGGVMATVDEVA